MTPVRIVSDAPLEIAGQFGETNDLNQEVVLIVIDDRWHAVPKQYVRRVPWPLRLAAHVLAGGQEDVAK